MDTAQPFLAIVMATNRPQHITAFFENLRATAADQNSFEVLIRADEGDEATIQAIAQQKELSKFRIHLLVEKNRKGTFMLHHAYDRLTKELASPSVYFFWNLTDEIRMQTQGWDQQLKTYIKFYSDDLFRLKPTHNNINNYYRFDQCLYFPDNYSLLTRRWLELLDGWGDYWGTDSWHQCIDWYLGQCNIPQVPHAVFRSVPVFTIGLGGQASGEVLSSGQSHARRMDMARRSFAILRSFAGRENFNRLAKRLHAHYIAKQKGLNEYRLQEDRKLKRITVFAPDNTVIDVLNWNLRFNCLKRQIIQMLFHYLDEKNIAMIAGYVRDCGNMGKNILRSFIQRGRQKVQENAASSSHAAMPGTANMPPHITEYLFREGENRFFPSGTKTIKHLIDSL